MCDNQEVTKLRTGSSDLLKASFYKCPNMKTRTSTAAKDVFIVGIEIKDWDRARFSMSVILPDRCLRRLLCHTMHAYSKISLIEVL